MKPAVLMKFVQGLTASIEENEEINYDDFLRAIDKYGSGFDPQEHVQAQPAVGGGLVDKVKYQVC